MADYVSPELYDEYKEVVLRMGLGVQRFERVEGIPQIRNTSSCSDEEIALRLGLTEEQVCEIRCIAEVDLTPLEEWTGADDWKLEKCLKALGMYR